MSVGVICGCMPYLASFFQRHRVSIPHASSLKRLFTRATSRSSRSEKTKFERVGSGHSNKEMRVGTNVLGTIQGWARVSSPYDFRVCADFEQWWSIPEIRKFPAAVAATLFNECFLGPRWSLQRSTYQSRTRGLMSRGLMSRDLHQGRRHSDLGRDTESGGMKRPSCGLEKRMYLLQKASPEKHLYNSKNMSDVSAPRRNCSHPRHYD